MNLTTVLILAQAISETSTATWAVLMVVVGFIVAGVLAAWRIYATRLSDAEGKVDDSRHSELKTMIGGVSSSVESMSRRFDGVEKRVGHLERGHAEIKARLGINANGEDLE